MDADQENLSAAERRRRPPDAESVAELPRSALRINAGRWHHTGPMSQDVRPLLQSDALKALESYWRSKMHGPTLPARRDIDPWEMRTFLPQVFLITVTQNPLRFWFRLVGTGVADTYGEDVTGRYVDEIDLNDVYDQILDDYRRATLEARPVYARLDYVKDDGRRVSYERLLLPLSSDGETVDMLLGGAVRLARTGKNA